MRVLVVANRHDADPGHVGDRLFEQGGRLRFTWRDRPGDLGDPPAGTEVVVLLGSSWSVATPVDAAALRAERALVGQAERSGIPVLAICYGAQVVAATAGAQVERAPRPEIGWVDLHTDGDRLAPAGPWFQFHEDRWIEHPGVPTLARNDNGPQAFRRRAVVGWQFHPEVTPVIVRRWVAESPEMVVAAGLDAERIVADTDAAADDAARRCRELVDAFLEEVVGCLRR